MICIYVHIRVCKSDHMYATASMWKSEQLEMLVLAFPLVVLLLHTLDQLAHKLLI